MVSKLKFLRKLRIENIFEEGCHFIKRNMYLINELFSIGIKVTIS